MRDRLHDNASIEKTFEFVNDGEDCLLVYWIGFVDLLTGLFIGRTIKRERDRRFAMASFLR
jgi:hypothetical protein